MSYKILNKEEIKKYDNDFMEMTYYVHEDKQEKFKEICKRYDVDSEHPNFKVIKEYSKFNNELRESGILIFNDN